MENNFQNGLHIFESDIADDVYDLIMGNTMHATMDFSRLFDRAYVDRDNAKIYLLDSGNNSSQFKITIERV